MPDTDAGQGYWFDTAPLGTAARPRNPLTRIGSLLPGRQLTNAQHDALADFAEANGLSYQSWIESQERAVPLPSLVLDGTCEAIVLNSGNGDTPYLEIGNHGWRYGKGEDDGSPARRGYIAIRHGFDLPRMYLQSQDPGAATVLAAASTVVNLSGFFDLERLDPTITPVESFRRRATRLELPPSLGFITYVDAEQAPRATALIDGPAAPLLSELAASFDVEVEREWIYAYSNFGELSTLDPEVWAWAFGSASRLLDVLAAWGTDIGDVRGRAWYTARHTPRPRKLDGELRALAPKQSGKARKFLFGGEKA